MQKLKAANLYRSELIAVNGKLVERYNKCLVQLGFSPTKLSQFHIDGIGWSPEIAEEKGDIHYMNNGEANPHGILISPLQKGKPIYTPNHSFDREMLQFIFNEIGDKINDITRDCAICIDFDQDIDAYYEPLDLLKYDDIAISFRLIDNLDTIQKKQLELVDKFNSDHNFIDENLHKQLLESAKVYGDLRNRDLSLQSLQYKTDSFYTIAFGGVYILRDFIKPIVVFEDAKWHKEAIKDTTYDVLIYHISQPELMDKLRDYAIIEYDLEKVVKTNRYERIKKYEFAHFLKDTTHSVNNILNDSVLFKSYLNKLDIESRKKVMCVERYLEKMDVSNQYKIADIIDKDIFNALHKPHSSLEPRNQDLIWKLLVNVSAKDMLYLYWYDKEAFYKKFKEWDDSLKDWVIETISNNI